MKKIVSLSVLMLMIGSCAYAQKEYRQIREQLKNKNEGVTGTVENCLKNDKFKDDPELLHYGVEAWLVVNENQNRNAYLKQKYDTARLFDSVLNMYSYAVRRMLRGKKERKR